MFIAGNLMGPSMERGVRSRMTLGISPAEKRQMRLKQLSVFVHMQPEVWGRASRVQWELGSTVKMSKVNRVCG